jgi:hypothetical protein
MHISAPRARSGKACPREGGDGIRFSVRSRDQQRIESGPLGFDVSISTDPALEPNGAGKSTLMRIIATAKRRPQHSPARTSPLAGSIVCIARRAPNHLERAPIEASPLQAATSQIVIRQLRQLRVDASRLPALAPGRQDGACTGPKRPRPAADLNVPGAPMDRRKRFPAAHREAPLCIGS